MAHLFLAGLFCLFGLSAIAQTPTLETDKYMKLVASRSEELKLLKNNLISNKLCPGVDYLCLQEQMSVFGVKTTSDLALGAAVINSYVFKAKKLLPQNCDELCQMKFQTELIQSNLDWMENFKLEKLAVYAEFPADKDEVKYLKVVEDFTAFRMFLQISEKLITVVAKFDTKLLAKEEDKIRISNIKQRLDQLKSGQHFKKSELANLPKHLQKTYYKYLISSGNKPIEEQKKTLELLKRFKAAVKKN